MVCNQLCIIGTRCINGQCVPDKTDKINSPVLFPNPTPSNLPSKNIFDYSSPKASLQDKLKF